MSDFYSNFQKNLSKFLCVYLSGLGFEGRMQNIADRYDWKVFHDYLLDRVLLVDHLYIEPGFMLKSQLKTTFPLW